MERTERRAAGKAQRAAVPRRSLGMWRPGPARPDPVAILETQATTRVPELVPIRYGRMVASPFAFLRGAAAVMAADLAPWPSTGIPVQLCGDAHLANFGVFATAERHLVFDLNDFDETLPGPWEWDLKRLVASFAVAGRDRAFPRATIDEAVATVARSYREHLATLATARTLDVWYTRVDVESAIESLRSRAGAGAVARTERQVAKARTRTSVQAQSKLTEVVDGHRRIVDDPPLVERLPDEYRERVLANFARYRDSVAPEVRVLLDRFRIVDAARKVVGVGSVGTRAWIVLLEGGGDDDPLFLQLKEAQASVLEAHLGPSAYAHHGERVVRGQRLVQAGGDLFLGFARDEEGGVDYYWRQLRDMKGSADLTAMPAANFAAYGEVCGWALARAHARSGDAAHLAGYLGTGGSVDDAMVRFAHAYADQTERDHAALAAAVASGRVPAEQGI